MIGKVANRMAQAVIRGVEAGRAKPKSIRFCDEARAIYHDGAIIAVYTQSEHSGNYTCYLMRNAFPNCGADDDGWTIRTNTDDLQTAKKKFEEKIRRELDKVNREEMIQLANQLLASVGCQECTFAATSDDELTRLVAHLREEAATD